MMCCGLEIPESVGKYGCPNCLGDKKARVSRIVTSTNRALLESDDAERHAETLQFPRQEIF